MEPKIPVRLSFTLKPTFCSIHHCASPEGSTHKKLLSLGRKYFPISYISSYFRCQRLGSRHKIIISLVRDNKQRERFPARDTRLLHKHREDPMGLADSLAYQCTYDNSSITRVHLGQSHQWWMSSVERTRFWETHRDQQDCAGHVLYSTRIKYV